MKTKLFTTAFTIAILAFVLISCTKEDDFFSNEELYIEAAPVDYKSAQQTTYFGTPTVVPFMAGQNIEMGSVTVANDADYVYVILEAVNNWVIGKSHVYVGTKELLPVNKNGNPQIGHFPYTSTHNPMVTYHMFKIERDKLPTSFTVAVHAEVHKIENGQLIQSETAWGKGLRFVTKGSWAMYFGYTIQEKQCTYVTETFDYFGGQTINTGILSVTNDETYLYITYQMSSNWYMNKVHLFVGELQNLPVNKSKTPIPGQFPYVEGFASPIKSHTFTIELAKLPDCYIIAAHAELVQIENNVILSKETGWSFGTPFPETNRWGWYSSYCTQVCNN